MRRVKTGISNLDSIMGGGIPRNSVILVKGSPGAGKSNLGLEYLYRGALKGENGLYISFQETENEVLRATTFDWNFEEKVRDGTIKITKFDPYRYEQVADILRSTALENDAKRVVMDPITDLDLYIDSRKDQRKTLLQIKDEIQDLDATCLLMAEAEEATELEQELSDGILDMDIRRNDNRIVREILIKKLKGSDFEHNVHTYEIKSDGLKVE